VSPLESVEESECFFVEGVGFELCVAVVKLVEGGDGACHDFIGGVKVSDEFLIFFVYGFDCALFGLVALVYACGRYEEYSLFV